MFMEGRWCYTFGPPTVRLFDPWGQVIVGDTRTNG